MAITFDDFLMTVPEENTKWVLDIDEELKALGCTISIKDAKSGYVVSYQYDKKTVMNWVFRKTGMLARIYGNSAGKYEDLIAALPEEMQKKMKNSRDCKKLNGGVCSPTCVGGMVFNLDAETFKKCRLDGMQFKLEEDNFPHIKDLVVAEVKARKE